MMTFEGLDKPSTFPRNHIVKALSFAFLACVNSFIADKYLLTRPFSHLSKILIDNIGCHALIGLLTWLSYCHTLNYLMMPRRVNPNTLIENLLAFVCGSSIDVDHFFSGILTSGSLSLYAATHLKSRPYGHAVTILMLLSVTVYHIQNKFRYANKISGSSILWITGLAHLLRDSSRRGLWFWPILTTPELPYNLHLVLLFLHPLLSGFIDCKFCRSERRHEEPVDLELLVV
jgi:hypothetical protein